MDSHLVAVKVGVKRSTHKRMKLDRLALYQNRLKCLDSQSMERRGTVQHNRVLFDNILQHIPYF